MNSSLLTLFLVASSAVGFSRADNATDEQVAARSDVIDLAGAFQNDGFKIRDGDWFGTISKDQPKIISVNLYTGNAYWFTVATPNKGAKINVSVFDDQASRYNTSRTKLTIARPLASVLTQADNTM